MHDWTLLSILVNWGKGSIEISLLDQESKAQSLMATGFVDLRIPRKQEWGASVSVNKILGPSKQVNGYSFICLELQSGDRIEIEALTISSPK